MKADSKFYDSLKLETLRERLAELDEDIPMFKKHLLDLENERFTILITIEKKEEKEAKP